MNPMGRLIIGLQVSFYNHDEGKDTDIWALENGYISVVPIGFDVTAHDHIQKLNFFES